MEVTMPDPDPLPVLLRYLDAANAGDVDTMAALVAPGFVHHSGAGDLDIEGVKGGLQYYRKAFPDLLYDVEEILVVDGGTAAVARWTMRGTHEGRFSGSEPTHRTIAARGLSLHRVENGLIVEDWEYSDDVGVLQALGFQISPPVVADPAAPA
jgi:steroid delta-isomerase-like uncharacterized protein